MQFADVDLFRGSAFPPRAGNVAEWLAGLGTVGVVAVALATIVEDRRRHDDELAEVRLAAKAEAERWRISLAESEEARRTSEAARVAAYLVRDVEYVDNPTQPGKRRALHTGWSLEVRNGSVDYLVRWRVAVRESQSDNTLFAICCQDTGALAPVAPGARPEVFDLTGIVPLAGGAFVADMAFEDVHGEVWLRGARGTARVAASTPLTCGRHEER